MARRLPVYLLIDTSGSMKGEPIESVKVGIESMLNTLRRDPYALETVNISIITFDNEAKQILPLTPLDELQMPALPEPASATFTGAALNLLMDSINREVQFGSRDQKGDWMPILFIMTDGKPSDLQVYNEAVKRLKSFKFSTIVACAAGPKAKSEYLRQLTDNVFQIDTLDGTTFMKFFKWVSDIIGEGGKSVGATDSMALPPPPEELYIVI